MIHPDEAVALIDSLDVPVVVQSVPLAEATGRVPVRALVARVDQPPFDKSAMDGFAYRSREGVFAAPGEAFAVIGTVAAGADGGRPLEPGECARIMTGAPVPPGTTAVHRLEFSDVRDGLFAVQRMEREDNIVRRGENLRSGAPLPVRGRLRPQDLGVLAADGVTAVEVARVPRLAVVSSGDELRAPGEVLGIGQIYDSNGPQLVAQAREAGCAAEFSGRVADNPDALCDAIGSVAGLADIVVVSGGVSAGDFDYVPDAFSRLGFSQIFHGLTMKPGKPTWFGRRGNVFGFGMPGNPVSTFVNFEVLVKPLVARFLGLRHEPAIVVVELAERLSRRSDDRVEFVPVRLDRSRGPGMAPQARPVLYSGSTMLDALSRADALVRFEIGQRELPMGTVVDARPI